MKTSQKKINEEVKAVASCIEELAQYYTPPVNRLNAFAGGLPAIGCSVIEPQSAKTFILTDILKQNPEIMDDHLSQVPMTSLNSLLLLVDISEYLPISIIKECFLRANMTWIEISNGSLVLISNRYSESELADLILEYRHGLYSDSISDGNNTGGFTDG